ncbi:MAG: type 4a pilus biogenesis protein PilO [Pseudomonadota bacterium]|nr:type 4a pilus biogenesis protein PilO [Pseudomonadota bacterium]
MDLSQLRELDLNTIGEWPNPAKVVGIAILCACVAGAWYYFDTRDQLERLDVIEKKETQLRASFEAKQQKAANLAAYRDQLEQMKESFGAMLRQLPDKTEVASLLVDVSQTGLAAGLEFELFQPSGEQLKDFYAEYPIDLRVTGRYHEFGRFISGLAALPRIVTIHNVSIAPQKAERENVGDPVPLALQAQVKTYRYLDEEAVSLDQEVPQ